MFENYTDDTGDNSIYEDEGFKMHTKIRKNCDTMTSAELSKNYEFVIERFYKLIDKIGRDYFIFYDDGTIEYIWSYERKTN